MTLRILIPLWLLASSLAAETRPNILLILIDDLGWTDLHCQGNARLSTPNIDRLAGQGMRFTDAYAAAPVCSPTRAAVLTGQSPARLRITNHIPDRPGFARKDAAMIEALDTSVGRVLSALDELNLSRDTLVVFTPDNGAFGQASGQAILGDGLTQAFRFDPDAGGSSTGQGWQPTNDTLLDSP
ncbi:MAG: sulfatase-like hydrolase/transferase [Verrucomicrobiales bacterium]|nr:sulfatase-like hydrolase/transferase [Verrucomicrobiales bacterium]